jgi:hypothetical protein
MDEEVAPQRFGHRPEARLVKDHPGSQLGHAHSFAQGSRLCKCQFGLTI